MLLYVRISHDQKHTAASRTTWNEREPSADVAHKNCPFRSDRLTSRTVTHPKANGKRNRNPNREANTSIQLRRQTINNSASAYERTVSATQPVRFRRAQAKQKN